MSNFGSVRHSVYALILAVGLTAANPVPAFANEVHHFEIASGDNTEVIQEFAAQSGVQILASVTELQGKQLKGVSGTLSTDEGLKALLQGTDLTPQYVGERTVALVKVRKNSSTGQDAQADEPWWVRFRLAQASQAVPTETTSAERNNEQAPQKEEGTLQEVIVTSQRREERLLDVPLSVSVLSADALAQANVVSIDDLAKIVPGLVVTNSGRNRFFFIRGIGNVTGNFPLVGAYMDETPLAVSGFFEIDPRTYDLDRIEVLRGPQGTLYGDGSVGGTIRYITKKPDLHDFSGSIDTSLMGTLHGDPSERVDPVINMPLIPDKLAVRAAASIAHDGGWFEQPAAKRENINIGDLTNVRTKLLWKPIDELSIDAMAIVNRHNYVPDSFENAPYEFDQAFGLLTTPLLKDSYEVYNFAPSYDFGFAKLLSSTTHINQHVTFIESGEERYKNNQLASYFYTPYHPYGTRTTSQEIRLSSEGNGRLEWTVGGFYKDFHLYDDYQSGFYSGAYVPGAALPGPFQYNATNNSKSNSLFADLSYKVFPALTLGAGTRYFWDSQNYINGPGTYQTGKFHSLDPRFYADLGISQQLNVYASAAKGFRSGGFNGQGQPPYGPEQVWTYEIGTKGNLLDGRLTFDTSLYYSRYSDFVVYGTVISYPIAIGRNAGNARIDGVEASLSSELGAGWKVSLNGTYTDTRVTEIEALGTGLVVGDQINYIPPYSFTTALEKSLQLFEKNVLVNVEYSQRAKMRLAARNVDNYLESGVLNLLDVSIGFNVSSKTQVRIFGENLLNDRDLEFPPISFTRPRPTSVGIELRTAF